MYQLSKMKLFGALLLNLFLFSLSAEAKDCNSKSPNFTEGDDTYYDLGLYKRLTTKEQKAISSYFSRISGKWEGSLIYTECKGSSTNPERITKTAKVTSKIQNNGNSVLSAAYDASYHESGITSLNKIKTLGNKSIFSLNFSNGNNLGFSEKYRKRSATGGTFLVENIYGIQLDKKSLKLDLTVYHNGFFAWKQSIKLK